MVVIKSFETLNNQGATCLIAKARVIQRFDILSRVEHSDDMYRFLSKVKFVDQPQLLNNDFTNSLIICYPTWSATTFRKIR